MNEQIVIGAFYKFVDLADYVALRPQLHRFCMEHGIKGSILLAEEGINGTIAGSREEINAVFRWLREDERLSDLEVKESHAAFMPFKRMKVRLKKEIVTFRQGVSPLEAVGEYVEAADWNALISEPDVVVIDTRNDVEIELGTFQNAVNPHTESFTQFADYVQENLDPAQNKRVAMFCTGGIRCEKATAYLLEQGFEEVYHLKGGILKYLEDVPQEKSMWLGECFVFDERVTVDHDLRPGKIALCKGCWQPVRTGDKLSEKYEEGVSCPRCFDGLTEERRASLRERQKQVLLAEARGEVHIGRVSHRKRIEF